MELRILGADGQVGHALAAAARRSGIPHRVFGRKQCDVTDIHAVESAIRDGRWVVNCSAYTAVDQAETEQEAAHRVNAIGPANIAAACAAAGIALVHISTDYVFDGESPHPAREDDPPRPLSVYGRSKLGGETAVRETLARHIILRTSWVFSAHGQNFVRTILRLARTQSDLRIVADQIGGPTAASDIAAAILAIVSAGSHGGFAAWGTYHFCGAPAVSWCEFGRAILAGSHVAIHPIASEDYPRPARRPRNSFLNCSRILEVFGVRQPDWRIALREVCRMLAAEMPETGKLGSSRRE